MCDVWTVRSFPSSLITHKVLLCLIYSQIRGGSVLSIMKGYSMLCSTFLISVEQAGFIYLVFCYFINVFNKMNPVTPKMTYFSHNLHQYIWCRYFLKKRQPIPQKGGKLLHKILWTILWLIWSQLVFSILSKPPMDWC